jgi:cell division septation protein DedD
MQMFMRLLFVGVLLAGCATVPVDSGGLRFYQFTDPDGVGLIRAFRDQAQDTTVLQFAGLHENPVIADSGVHQVQYERIGEHYVIVRGSYPSLTVTMPRQGASVTLMCDLPRKADAKPEQVAEKSPPVIPSSHQEANNSTPIVLDPPRQEVTLAPPPTPVTAGPAKDDEASANPPSISSGLTGYVVQVESLNDRRAAEELKTKLTGKGYDAEIKVRTGPKSGKLFAVRLRPAGAVEAWDSMNKLRHDLRVQPILMEIPAEELAAYESSAE